MSKVVEALESAVEKVKTSLAEAKNVTIANRKLTQEELNEFVSYVSTLSQDEREKGVSLTSYVKNKFYADNKDCVVVPDLTGLELNSTGKRINLQGVDFTGSTLNKVKIENCNLTDAVFCECDMNDVYLDNTTLVNTDFRGAILVGATLGKSYDFIERKRAAELALEEKYFQLALGDDVDYGVMAMSVVDDSVIEARLNKKKQELEEIARGIEAEQQKLVGGIKLDTTDTLAISYQKDLEAKDLPGKIKSELARLMAEKTKELEAKIAPINKAVSDLGAFSNVSWLLGNEQTVKAFENQKKAQEANAKELEEFRANTLIRLEEQNLAYRKDSFLKVYSRFADCDPCYQRGSSPEERGKKRVYIDTSVEDVTTYLLAITEPGKEKLTLNEFVRTKYNQENPDNPIPADTIVHADCSSKGDVKDFSRIHFLNAHLQGVSFAGSKLEHVIFEGTNISYSSFESCDMNTAVFSNATAKGTNFFRADLTGTTALNGSDFTGAILIKANAADAFMSKVKLCHVKGRFANLDRAVISQSNADGADFTSASLIRAEIEKTSMVGIKLDKAVLDHCKIETSDLSNASMENATAKYAELRGVQLQNIRAAGINLTEAYLAPDKLGNICDLEGAELDNAILAQVEAYKANLKNASINFANLEGAKLKDTIMEGAQAQFANLTGVVAEGLKASGVNMTGAMLQGMQAHEADFKGAILQDVNAKEADFTNAMMDEADLRGADFEQAILDRVKMNKARVNSHTKLKDAKSMEGIEADHLIDVDPNGEEIEIALARHIEREILIEDAQSRGFLRKAAGSVIQGTGRVIEGVSEFVKQPFSDKTGLRIGVIVGLVIALCVVASVAAPLIPGAWLATPFITTALAVANLIPGVGILTSSIALATIPAKMLAVTIAATAPTLFTAVGISVSATTLPILATAAAAVVTTVGSVAAGALAGRYVVQHIKLSHVAAAGAGFATGLAYGVFLGPLAPLAGIAGAIAGVVSTVAVNTTSQKLLSGITGGRTLDGLLASGIGWAGDITKKFGGRVGITPEQAELLKKHAAYQPVTREECAQQLAEQKAAKRAAEREIIVTVSAADISPQQRMAQGPRSSSIPDNPQQAQGTARTVAHPEVERPEQQAPAVRVDPSPAAERVEGAPRPNMVVSSEQQLQEAGSRNAQVARDDKVERPRQDPSQEAMPERAASVPVPSAQDKAAPRVEGEGPFAARVSKEKKQKGGKAAQKEQAGEVEGKKHQKIAENPPPKSKVEKVAAEPKSSAELGA